MKERIQYIDVAKGILMLCLYIGHMILYSQSNGVCDPLLKKLWMFVPLYSSYRVQAFFIISGLCSSFNVNLRLFLWKNIKSLFLPQLVLSIICIFVLRIISYHTIHLSDYAYLREWLHTGGLWFLSALFIDKMILWFVLKVGAKWQISIIVTLYLLGFLLDKYNFFYNYYYHRHAMLMLPYLYVGFLLKGKNALIDKWLRPLAIFGVISIVLQTILKEAIGYHLPTQDFNINITVYDSIIHFVNVITGTAFVWYLAKKLQNVYFLKEFGVGSLLGYLINGYVYIILFRLFGFFHNPDNTVHCVLFHIASYFVAVTIVFCLIQIVYKNKYLKWIVGKW